MDKNTKFNENFRNGYDNVYLLPYVCYHNNISYYYPKL